MTVEISSKDIERIFNDMRKNSQNFFEDSRFSANYKQKLVYNLLNAARAKNQEQFLSILVRAINANKDDPLGVKLSALVGEYIVCSNLEQFSKYSYAIILGIMSSRTNISKDNNGVSENE